MITMTRTKGFLLTAIATLMYVFLGIAFADGYFTSEFFNSETWTSSSAIAWLLLALIVVGGIFQTIRIPVDGIVITGGANQDGGQLHDPAGWRLFLGNTWFAVLWMPLRFFVGHEWLTAGEHKLRSDAWMSGGIALKGYWERAVAIPDAPGRPAITYDWFRDFLTYMLDHEWYTWFAKLVAIGEFLVGLGLVLGALVGIAAFFGTVLNFNFLMAGTTSTNPVLFGIGVFLVLGWKVAGNIGLDRVLLPALGTPWQMGKLNKFLRKRPHGTPTPPRPQVA